MNRHYSVEGIMNSSVVHYSGEHVAKYWGGGGGEANLICHFISTLLLLDIYGFRLYNKYNLL